MAKPNIYSELLSVNLELLFMNHPPPAELRELLRKNLFSVPNKRASDELICYLYSVIDEKKYNVNVTRLYMMLDKKMENTFYSLVHKFSKEISDEYPKENLPKVVKSFFLTPSGERYVQYLYKLTLIAMKNDLKAAGIVMHAARRPKDEEDIKKLETMNVILNQHLKAQAKSAEQSHAENKYKERLLKSQRKRKQKVLMELTADLKLKMEKCGLAEHAKGLTFSEHIQQAIKEWSTMLSQRCEKLSKNAEVVQKIKWNISLLNNAISRKKNGILGKHTSYLRNQELLDGLFPEDYLNNLLSQAEETLNALSLQGPIDLSPYITDLQELANKFQNLLDIVSQCSQLIIHMHDKTEAQIPQLEAALFSNEQLEVKNLEEEVTSYGHSLVDKLCESTPPEVLRTLRIDETRWTPPLKDSDTESQNASLVDVVNSRDMADTPESFTPVALLKPVCFERRCGGSTWKHAVLLSTIKKKRQQKENSVSDVEYGMSSLENLTGTPLSQLNKRTSNPMKSLNNLWTEDSENCSNFFGLDNKIQHVEVPSDNESPENSSLTVTSAVTNPVQTLSLLSGRPDSRLRSERINWIFPGRLQQRFGRSSSETVKHLNLQEQNKLTDLTYHRPNGRHSSEEDSTQVSEAFTSGNLSKEFHNFMQAVTNSNGSLMGASSVFESSSSPSAPGSNVTGIHMLEQTSLDFSHTSSHADTSLAHWDDEKDLKRILCAALSPAGISSAEVRSSTPITTTRIERTPEGR